MGRPEPWRSLAERLRASGPFLAWRERGGAARRLPLAAAAWVVDLLSEELARPALVLVPHESDALAWLEASRLFAGEERAWLFPSPSLSPYAESEPSLAIAAQEAVAIDRLLAGEAGAVVATARSLFRRLPEREEFLAAVRTVAAGDLLATDELVDHLTRHGFRRVDLVSEVGEFAVRGGVLDCFPPGEVEPLRFDLFGDRVESVRRFDPTSQRSTSDVAAARLLPLTLFPSSGTAARALARLLAEELPADAGAETTEHLRALAEGRGFAGWEQCLPLVAEATAMLPDLAPAALALALEPPSLAAEIESHAARLAAEWRARREHHRFAPAPERLEWPRQAVLEAVERAAFRLGLSEEVEAIDFAGATTDLFHGQLPRFPREVETARARGERLVLVAPAEHHARLADLLAGREVALGAGGVELAAGDLARGFRLPAAGVAVYGEGQLLPRPFPLARGKRARFGPFLQGLRDLKIGDYVVHGDHGIGQYVGLRQVVAAEPAVRLPPSLAALGPPPALDGEVMEIAYAAGQRLLVPLARLDLVQKYSGLEGVAPRLDELGGTSWNRTQARVRKGLRDMADELLKLYAERQLAQAPMLPGPSDLERQFAAAFAYEETPDQLEAIAAILADLGQVRPMDRLLCGDVGFGKTEVAMRAAFRAVDCGFQVAVLAPTTILADQHLETFRRRFAGFPVEIEMVSRFRHPGEVREVKKRLAAGRIDVLIGTHRLLSKDIELARLGLLIVDEEQRFGVAQKERLKQLKRNVHVLAMTATPLPRTLQLSLAGVRDLAVIETPPRDRMAVETAILPLSDEVVREAILWERGRGGQVYFVHNRVEGIEQVASWLRDLVPDLRITIGHGQMDEDELMGRMHAFTRGEYDLLLATTIIENGIDIPNVNTMLIHRADRFGLAQLYQLRGRVGRSRELAYCYLLTDPGRALTPEARRRLEALHEFTELGAGFRIAARDLEIRGAGNLLGAEQSGHIAAVGIETYLKLLEQAVRESRGEAVEEAPAVALDLPVAMAIPPEYVGDASLRLEIYRRLATGEEGREELLAELADRFGPPPPAVHQLLAVSALKRRAEALRVQAISYAANRLTLRLRRDARIDVDRLIRFVGERQGRAFSPAGILTLELGAGQSALAAAAATLEAIA